MPSSDPHVRHWRANLLTVAALLAIWFLVGYVLPIFLVERLNEYRLGGFKLGFWFAQQGSIVAFILLVLAYVVIMNRLDRRFGVAEEE